MTICIVDPSILDELLNVPGWASRHDEILTEYVQRQREREAFLMSVRPRSKPAQTAALGVRNVQVRRYCAQ